MDNEKKKTVSAGYRVINIFRTIFIYLLAIGVIIAAILFASDRSPQKSLFGFRYYTVLTASMEPEFTTGDLVVVKLSDADEINVGDIITFNPSSESDAYLTHRVTEKFEDYEGTGVTCFRTKGDANETEDSFLIESERVIGVVSFHIPKLGYIIRFVQLKWYFILPLIVLLFIFFKLMKMYFQPNENNDDKDEKKSGTDEKSKQDIESKPELKTISGS